MSLPGPGVYPIRETSGSRADHRVFDGRPVLLSGDMTSLIGLVVGLVLLFWGRRLYWLFVAGIGFLTGLALAPDLLPGWPDWLILLAALVVAIVGAVVAILAQRLTIGLIGFVAGGGIGLLAAARAGVRRRCAGLDRLSHRRSHRARADAGAVRVGADLVLVARGREPDRRGRRRALPAASGDRARAADRPRAHRRRRAGPGAGEPPVRRPPAPRA